MTCKLHGVENANCDDSRVLRFSLFSLGYFLKEMENIFFVFLSSYRNTCESLGEHEKAVETLACDSCFYNSVETRKMFSIS